LAGIVTLLLAGSLIGLRFLLARGGGEDELRSGFAVTNPSVSLAVGVAPLLTGCAHLRSDGSVVVVVEVDVDVDVVVAPRQPGSLGSTRSAMSAGSLVALA
jgi:hypothetical protein